MRGRNFQTLFGIVNHVRKSDSVFKGVSCERVWRQIQRLRISTHPVTSLDRLPSPAGPEGESLSLGERQDPKYCRRQPSTSHGSKSPPGTRDFQMMKTSPCQAKEIEAEFPLLFFCLPPVLEGLWEPTREPKRNLRKMSAL